MTALPQPGNNELRKQIFMLVYNWDERRTDFKGSNWLTLRDANLLVDDMASIIVPALAAARKEAVQEALDVIAHIVSQANVNPVVEGDFIERYNMPVGSIHKAIPFLARYGVFVDEFGAVHKSPKVAQSAPDKADDLRTVLARYFEAKTVLEILASLPPTRKSE